MRLLILGGTRFLGRAVARHARDAGHQVTCLARGGSGGPIDGVRFVTADRDRSAALSVLDGESFDAVVDVTRRPSHARRAVRTLAGRAGHWVYVSSINVYADTATVGQQAASAPLLPAAPPEVDDPGSDPDSYGRRKVACEQAVQEAFGSEGGLRCRAGLIVGPEDPSGRFTYWVTRLARGGRVLAPGNPQDLVQVVDVRDLAAWLVYAAEHRLGGVYDGCGAPVPLGDLLTEVAAGVCADPAAAAEFVWVDPDFLVEQGVRYWAGERSLPLWAPRPAYAGLVARDTSPALAAGLATRPVARTAADTLKWVRGDPGPHEPAGLSAAAEAALLRTWDAQEGARTVSR